MSKEKSDAVNFLQKPVILPTEAGAAVKIARGALALFVSLSNRKDASFAIMLPIRRECLRTAILYAKISLRLLDSTTPPTIEKETVEQIRESLTSWLQQAEAEYKIFNVEAEGLKEQALKVAGGPQA